MTNPLILFFAALSFISTFMGGLVGLKYKSKLNLILGFTAGVLLAVVAFDIFPEMIQLTQEVKIDPINPMITLVIGFMVFHIFEKLFLIHYSQEELYGSHKHPLVGVASALALAGHSFLDGIGIGLGFQVSASFGIIIAIAVVAHDFSDGLNTVSLMLIHKNTSQKAFLFLAIDALAPVLGAISTYFFSVPDAIMVLYLGFFAGFLLYICASDILPEAHSEHSSWKTIAMTVLGILLIFTVTRFT
ncbi:MAG: ZIP family metal transporter [Chloroflexi bacterium]|nr:ZIP family metal transporter [Chloroflexota bacterium]MBI5080731.1 ZIP family metal transporter [Chloroflexota bacterium]